MKSNSGGVTLVELMMVVAILAMVFSLTFINFSELVPSASKKGNADLLITDLRGQQQKAMSGDTNYSSVSTSYGIYFGSNYYVLFKGAVYSASDTNNFRVNLEPTVSFTNISLPNSGNTIVFEQGSGNIKDYTTIPEVRVTLASATSGGDVVIKLNKYGATY
jgi:prepilin-type N-terminal cleavage/methylation domain-containing protein